MYCEQPLPTGKVCHQTSSQQSHELSMLSTCSIICMRLRKIIVAYQNNIYSTQDLDQQFLPWMLAQRQWVTHIAWQSAPKRQA